MKTRQQTRILQLVDCIKKVNTLQAELGTSLTDPISIRRQDYISVPGKSILNIARLMGRPIEADLSNDPDTDEQQYEFYCRVNGITFFSYLYTEEETQQVVDILDYVNTKYNTYFSLNEEGEFVPSKTPNKGYYEIDLFGYDEFILAQKDCRDACCPVWRGTSRTFGEYCDQVVAGNNVNAEYVMSVTTRDGVNYLLWQDRRRHERYITRYKVDGVE